MKIQINFIILLINDKSVTFYRRAFISRMNLNLSWVEHKNYNLGTWYVGMVFQFGCIDPWTFIITFYTTVLEDEVFRPTF